jgi:hypothetical protein
MGLVLIILLILLLAGGGWGYRSGWYGGYGPAGSGYSPLGIVLLVVLILVIISLIGGPGWGWYHW